MQESTDETFAGNTREASSCDTAIASHLGWFKSMEARGHHKESHSRRGKKTHSSWMSLKPLRPSPEHSSYFSQYIPFLVQWSMYVLDFLLHAPEQVQKDTCTSSHLHLGHPKPADSLSITRIPSLRTSLYLISISHPPLPQHCWSEPSRSNQSIPGIRYILSVIPHKQIKNCPLWAVRQFWKIVVNF